MIPRSKSKNSRAISRPLNPVAVDAGVANSGTDEQQFGQPSGSDAGRQWAATQSLLPGFVYECDENLTVISTSSDAAQILGIRPERILGNRALWDERLLEDSRPALLARLKFLRPGEFVSETHQIIDDCGLPIWVAHGLRKIRTDAGVTIRGCMIPLGAVLQSKALDTGIIAQFVHKLGNYFQLVNLLIDTLKRGALAAKEIQGLQETVDRAVEFTRIFLHYSQILADSSIIDLGQILRAVIDSNAAAFLEKEVKLEDQLQDSLSGVSVNCDPAQLDIALHAILRNSLEATEPGGQVIVAGAAHATSLADRFVARVAIVDTGCGMDQTQARKAPAPFFTSKPERDGLGLSIAARLIELHGGRLTISSTKGHGTEVEIMLPIHSMEAGQSDDKTET